MPHLIIEISKNVVIEDDMALLHALNTALFDSGVFQNAKDIKSRIHRPLASMIGVAPQDGEHFITAHLLIMSGRDDATKQHLTKIILEQLKAHVGQHNTQVQYAVNLEDLSPHYQKSWL